MTAAFWAAHGAHAAATEYAEAGRGADVPPMPRQVGRWFERVHLEALQGTEGVEVLAANRQLRAEARTLGELDVLYRAGGRVVHREVAVKYYLAVGAGDDPAGWVGPNRRDRLDRKLDRLISHQLALPGLARAVDAWPQDLPTPDRSEVLLLGALFSPASDPRLPKGADPAVEHGRWYYASDFAQRFGRAPWVELEKPLWLSPEHVDRFEGRPARCLAETVSDRAGPMFVAREASCRAFVVPDGWWG